MFHYADDDDQDDEKRNRNMIVGKRKQDFQKSVTTEQKVPSTLHAQVKFTIILLCMYLHMYIL